MDHSIPLPHLSQSDHHSSVHTKYTTALVRTHGHRCEKYTISNSNTYVKMLSIDFSSAFNTNIPSKLGGLGINNSLCILALDSPTNRPRFVRLDSHIFSTLTLNTGVPQCCVLSSLLYSPPMKRVSLVGWPLWQWWVGLQAGRPAPGGMITTRPLIPKHQRVHCGHWKGARTHPSISTERLSVLPALSFWVSTSLTTSHGPSTFKPWAGDLTSDSGW